MNGVGGPISLTRRQRLIGRIGGGGVALLAGLFAALAWSRPGAIGELGIDALALSLCGVALVLRTVPGRGRAAGGCAAIAALALSLALARRMIGPDTIPAVGAAAGPISGSHWAAGAAGWLAVLAVWAFPRSATGRRTPAAVWLASALAAFAGANLLAPALPADFGYTLALEIPAPLAALLFLFGSAILLSLPLDHVGRILLAPGATGALARRLLIGVVLPPALLGGLTAMALYYDAVEARAVFVLLATALALGGLVLAFLATETASTLDQQREEAELAREDLAARLDAQNAQLQQTVVERTRELSDVNATLRSALAINSRLALVANHSTNGIVIGDAEGRIEWVNTAFERTTGYTFDEVKGRHPGHFLQGPRTDPATVARLRHAVRTGQACSVEILNYRKAGDPYWLILDLQPVRDPFGRLVNFISIQTDTTEQHLHQERLETLHQRFRLAARAAELGVWEWTALTRRTVWDDRMLEIYGLAAGQFAGTTDAWLECVHPDDRALLAAALAAATEGAATEGAAEFDAVYRIVRASDGAVRHIQSRGIVQCDADGVRITGTERDLTDERESAQRQAALNQRLQLALRSSNYGVWELDPAARRLVWDDRMLECYDLTREDFGGTAAAWFQHVHPDDRVAAEALVEQVISGALASYDTEFRIVRRDGKIRHLEAHGYLQRDARGRPLRLVGLARDITPETELREALRLAEQRWQLALEGSNDGIWDWNLSSNLLFHDLRSARILQRPLHRMPQTPAEWLRLVHPDDVAPLKAAVVAHLAGRTPRMQHEYRVLGADGSWEWLLARGRIVSRAPDGRPLRMAGTHTDITDRKRLQQRLQAAEQLASEVAELAQIAGWEWEKDARRLTWTPLLKTFHDLDPSAQPTLAEALAFFDAGGRAQFEAALAAAATDRTAFELELPITTAAGRRKWLRITGRPDLRHGRSVRVQGSVQDVTARRASDEARHELETQLFQAQKIETLGTLAGGIAHDFNNLLTGIIGYHELAADTLPPDHPAHGCLIEARHASLRARDLVEQILTFGRRSHASEHAAVEVSLVVEEARRFLRATLPATVEIDVQLASDCGAILADSTQIHQVLINLGSNAAHAMRERGGLFRIAAARVDLDLDRPGPLGGLPAGRYVRLDVSDTGHGMDEATLQRIFDPFFTTKDPHEGTGLGLAVVHGIVRVHRGAITVESTPGEGTTFHIYLPAAAGPTAHPFARIELHARGAGEQILIVDDEELVANCTRLALQNRGYRAITFNSAEAGLAAITAAPADCAALITDQTMPGMQGTKLAARARALIPDLPIVLVSGYFSKIPSGELAGLEPIELLAKPFTTDELARAVARAFAVARHSR